MTRPRCNACEWFEMYNSSLMPEMSGKGRCWRNAWATTIANVVDCNHYCNCWRPASAAVLGLDTQQAPTPTDTQAEQERKKVYKERKKDMHDREGGPAMGAGGRVGTSFPESSLKNDEKVDFYSIKAILTKLDLIEEIVRCILEVCNPEVATKQLQCNCCPICCPGPEDCPNPCQVPLVQILEEMPDSPAPENADPIPCRNFLKEDPDSITTIRFHWDIGSKLVGCSEERECMYCDKKCDRIVNKEE